LRVDGATAPFWLVLGQSHSDGWEATVEGGGDLGAPVLVDGYANGWLVDPSAAASGPITIELRWTPQRLVWIGLAVSGLAVAACVVLAVIDPGRRRRRGSAPGAALAWADPRLDVDLDRRSPARPAVVAGVAAGAALVFGGLGGWLPALVAAAVAAIALWRPRWRRWLALVPGAFMGATVVYIVGKQVRFDLPASLDWPNEFELTGGSTWAAVASAATLAVAAAVLDRQVRAAPEAPVEEAAEGGTAPALRR
jgi:hypothetical protein